VLRKIDLSNNPITKEGVSSIAYALQYNTALYDVNLSQTQIGTEGCDQIISSLLKNPKSVIYRLDLRHDGVNEPQIKLLLQFAKQNRRN
jgi:Ran GTPase-activating protein (RanGAP) involved in mRNA processing and transport